MPFMAKEDPFQETVSANGHAGCHGFAGYRSLV